MLESIEKILASVNLSVTDPKFPAKIFTALCKARKEAQAKDGDNLKRVCAEEYDELSRRIDATHLQESCSVRNVLRTRRLANLLINDKGELNAALLPRVITHLTNYLYSLGPNRQHDAKRNEYLLKVLTSLKDKKELVQLIRQISKPHAHPLADQIIRDTLQLPSTLAITDAHARRAALAAWMCYLRQNIGSCFATAPAIIIQTEQPEQFLTDIREILNTGRLKRTFGGTEYSVPLSVSWGAGDLRRPVVLVKSKKREQNAPWNAPGIINAFEEAGLFEKENGTKEKIKHTEFLIHEAYPEWNEKRPYVLTSPEEILQRVLMRHVGITAQDLQAYNNRPKAMIFSGLMMQPSKESSMGGKGEASAHYLYLFERAISAFKALSENALLKSWEYTIASFSETKSEFTRWNLYSSLGLKPEEPYGIGQCLYNIIVQKLDQMNRKVADLQAEYEHMFLILKQLEVHARNMSNDKDTQWMRADYQSKLHEFQTLEEMRNKEHAKAELFANLFNILVERYDKLFPQYFQEVYDADLHEVDVGPFDDSPAGFRLLYKHGRTSTALWTKITNPTEFSEALSNFFVSTEPEITSTEILQSIQNELADIITALVTHVKTKEFLETALHRMAKAHHAPLLADPLEHLDKAKIKPWAYVSGGTMQTLLSCYYRREQFPTEVSRWVENPTELLVFLADSLKQIPYTVLEPFLKMPNKSLLMYSPTHAFLLRPGTMKFKEGWQAEAYTYTWIRDSLIRPLESFVESIVLDDGAIQFLLDQFLEKISENHQPYFKKVFSFLHGPISTLDFREHLIERIEQERGLQFMGRGVLSQDEIDGTLYSLLPLTPIYELEQRIRNVFDILPQTTNQMKTDLDTILEKLMENVKRSDYIDAQQLQEICVALLGLILDKTSLPFNGIEAVTVACQQLGYAMPAPIIFADTNWTKDYFAFLVSPATGTLQLWRVDILGRTGYPMSVWNEWLYGARKDRSWAVLPRPEQYTPGNNILFRPPMMRL